MYIYVYHMKNREIGVDEIGLQWPCPKRKHPSDPREKNLEMGLKREGK